MGGDHERRKVAAGFMPNDAARMNRWTTLADENLESGMLALAKM
jgi:hypothetical protein